MPQWGSLKNSTAHDQIPIPIPIPIPDTDTGYRIPDTGYQYPDGTSVGLYMPH